MRALTTTLLLLAAAAASAQDYFIYYGCYTGQKTGSKGIYVSRFNSSSGEWSSPELAGETGSPSFLAIHPSHKYLYSVGEMAVPGDKGGGVTAWKVDAGSGKLSQVNQVSSVGAGPCHINVEPSGKAAVVANYGGGSTASYRIEEGGALSAAVTFVQHEGSSVNAKRQAGPHAHSANFSPDGKYAFIADLGLDQVKVYALDAAAGSMKAHGQGAVPAGSGPRHFSFHPNGKVAFCNGEMLMNVTSFSYDAAAGSLQPLETVSVLPEGTALDAKYSTAEVRVHTNGKFVYVSCRGHDTIARLAYDETSQKLKHLGNTPSGGQIPRNFNLDPSGQWLFAAHQNSHNVVLFKVNAETGELTPTGKEQTVGGCVCVRFLPVAKE